jgi:hypothetical protein
MSLCHRLSLSLSDLFLSISGNTGFFHYWHQDKKADAAMSTAANKTFVVIPLNSSSVEVVMKDENGMIVRQPIYFKSGKWYEAPNGGGEAASSLDNFIDKQIVKKLGYKAFEITT